MAAKQIVWKENQKLSENTGETFDKHQALT